jgi:hypothetical protein
MRLLVSVLVLSFFFVCCAQNAKKADTPKEQASAKAAEVAKNAPSNTAAAALADKVTCAWKGQDQRILEVLKTEKGCQLMYTKGGSAKSIANSNHGIKHCQKVQKRIHDKLVQNGFECK